MEEIWKDIIWYEWLYQVSNLWNIRSFKNNRRWLSKSPKLLSLYIWSHWYYLVSLWTPFKVLVHRLVAEIWLSNSENKRTVNHKDWNKLNNHVDNLERATDGENNLHAYKTLWRKPFQKSVGQYTLDGILIRVWDNLTHASQSIWVKKQNIISCCRNYRWRITSWWYKRQYL